ncbi:MAG TPA: hypothetical protein DEQ25_18750 [Methylophaga sp.]|nr:hypothetical protein [Methylophaga sp.]
MSKAANRLLPVKNCWVKKVSRAGEDIVGRVVDSVDRGDDIIVTVKWRKTGQISTESLSDLRSGLKLQMEVQDLPYSRVRTSLGEGVIQRLRTIGDRD